MEIWNRQAHPAFVAFMASLPVGFIGICAGLFVARLDVVLWGGAVVVASVIFAAVMGLMCGRVATAFLTTAFACGVFLARIVFLDGVKHGREGPGGDLKKDLIEAVMVLLAACVLGGLSGGWVSAVREETKLPQ